MQCYGVWCGWWFLMNIIWTLKLPLMVGGMQTEVRFRLNHKLSPLISITICIKQPFVAHSGFLLIALIFFLFFFIFRNLHHMDKQYQTEDQSCQLLVFLLCVFFFFFFFFFVKIFFLISLRDDSKSSVTVGLPAYECICPL